MFKLYSWKKLTKTRTIFYLLVFFPFPLDVIALQQNLCTNILSSTLSLSPLNFTTTALNCFPIINPNSSNKNPNRKGKKKCPNKTAVHQCKICFRSVQSKGSLNRHYRQTHGLSFEDIQKLYHKLQQQNQQVQEGQSLSRLLTTDKGNGATSSASNLLSSCPNINAEIALQSNNQILTYNPLNILAAHQENVFIIDEYLDDSVDLKN